MQLSEYFPLDELIASEIAARKGIDNTPPEPLLPNLRVRHLLGDRPIHVNSGYRCPDLNGAVGGAPDSLHMKGLAADIRCPQFGVPLDVCRAIAAADVSADQIITSSASGVTSDSPLPGLRPGSGSSRSRAPPRATGPA